MTRETCFELDGVRVHGDPHMSDDARAALREIIEAAKSAAEMLEEPTPEQVARLERIRARFRETR